MNYNEFFESLNDSHKIHFDNLNKDMKIDKLLYNPGVSLEESRARTKAKLKRIKGVDDEL